PNAGRSGPRTGPDTGCGRPLSHGCATRGAADAEIQGEPPLVEPDIGTTAIAVHGSNGVLERGIGAGLETVRGRDRLEAGCRRSRGGERGSRPGTTRTAASGR